MLDYQQGKIYKIVSEQTDKCYVGSTCQKYLHIRMRYHKNQYKRWLNDKHQHYITSYEILKYDDAKIILIELYPCNTKKELLKREGHYQKQLNCVNKVMAGRTPEEYREENKDNKVEYDKIYREKNKDKIVVRDKIYRENNKDKLKESNKKYYENNKDKLKESNKIYRENNKVNKAIYDKNYREKNRVKRNEYRKEKIKCECGTVVSRGNLTKHKKTNKHKTPEAVE